MSILPGELLCCDGGLQFLLGSDPLLSHFLDLREEGASERHVISNGPYQGTIRVVHNHDGLGASLKSVGHVGALFFSPLELLHTIRVDDRFGESLFGEHEFDELALSFPEREFFHALEGSDIIKIQSNFS